MQTDLPKLTRDDDPNLCPSPNFLGMDMDLRNSDSARLRVNPYDQISITVRFGRDKFVPGRIRSGQIRVDSINSKVFHIYFFNFKIK